MLNWQKPTKGWMNSSFSWRSVLLLVDWRRELGIRLCLRGTIRGVQWFSASREVVKFIETPTEVEVLAAMVLTIRFWNWFYELVLFKKTWKYPFLNNSLHKNQIKEKNNQKIINFLFSLGETLFCLALLSFISFCENLLSEV